MDKLLLKQTAGISLTFAIVLTATIANAAKCQLNTNSDWRKVGAGQTIKYVCKTPACGGPKSYLILRQKKLALRDLTGIYSYIKRNGKRTSSPAKGYKGYRANLTREKNFAVAEVYRHDDRDKPAIYLEAQSTDKRIAQSNFSKAKSNLRCR